MTLTWAGQMHSDWPAKFQFRRFLKIEPYSEMLKIKHTSFVFYHKLNLLLSSEQTLNRPAHVIS